jgi:hypothetical protein
MTEQTSVLIAAVSARPVESLTSMIKYSLFTELIAELLRSSGLSKRRKERLKEVKING